MRRFIEKWVLWDGIRGSRCDGATSGKDACATGAQVFTQIRRRHGHDGARKGFGVTWPKLSGHYGLGFWLKCVPLYGRKVVNEYCKCRRSA